MSNAKALADLQGMAKKLELLAEMPETAAPLCADAIFARTALTIERGTTPYGEPWKLVQTGPRKGQKALVNSLRKVFVTFKGPVISIRVRGIEGRHNYGGVAGRVKRQIVPDKRGLPRAMSAAITEILVAEFNRTMESDPV
jgi:hypothetical protein